MPEITPSSANLCISDRSAIQPPDEAGITPSRSVLIAELSADKKRRLWAWMQTNDPETAAQLAGADTRAILEAFPGSSPVLDITYVETALT